MSRLGTAKINIGANLGPLKEGLQTAKRSIAGSIRSISRGAVGAIGRMASSLIATVQRAAKYATAAVAGFMTASVWAAARQQDAEVRLETALRSRGEYTRELSHILQDYAEQIQRVTVVGNEQVMQTKALALQLDVATDRVAEFSHEAIALARAYGINERAAARYLALAERGDYTMLQRYIPTLREASTEQEKQALLTEQLAMAMELAESETWTFTGSLRQMRNAIGDAIKLFGRPMLDTFTRTFKGVRDWAIDNEQAFAEWGETVRYWVEVAMYHIREFFGLATAGEWGEFQKRFAAAWDVIKQGLRVAFDWVLPHAKEIGVMIGRGIVDGLKWTGKEAVGGMSTRAQYSGAAAGGAVVGAKVGGLKGAAVGAVGAPAVLAGAKYIQESREMTRTLWQLVDSLQENNRLQREAKRRGVNL